MFAGITNQMSQVSSWIGAKKGENDPNKTDEEKISPIAETESAPADVSSPTGKGSKLDMLTNVKGQIGGWIGSVPVPTVPNLFNKNADGTATDGQVAVDPPTVGEPEAKDDEDNSSFTIPASKIKEVTEPFMYLSDLVRSKISEVISATGGADSDAAAAEEEELPEDGKDGGIGGVSTKAVQGAKSIGSFFLLCGEQSWRNSY